VRIDISASMTAALLAGCVALGFAQAGYAQTGASPATQKSKPMAQPAANQEESRTPDTTSANNANGNVGETSGGNGNTAGKPMKKPAHAHGASAMGQ
jgi:hypothetical protein